MHKLNYMPTLAKRFLGLVIMFSAMAIGVFPQSVTDGSTPGALTPGSPTGSYPLSELDNVNLYNGNLNFGLPLANVSGRGAAKVPIGLYIEKHWRVEHAPNPNPLEETPIDYPTYVNWLDRAYFDPGRIELRTTGRANGDCGNTQEIWDPTAWSETLTRITFTAADGSEYELRDVATGGHLAANGPCHFSDSYRFRGTAFKSTDGSGLTFIANEEVVDDPFGNTGITGGDLVFRDGTRYHFSGAFVTWIRDRNGNLTTFTYGLDPNNTTNYGKLIVIRDSLNREMSFEYNVNDIAPYGVCDRISFKGFGGASRIIRISRTALSNVLRTTQTGDSSTPKSTLQLFPSLTGSSSTAFDPSDMVSAVWLPNGKSYNFRYNVFSELARVELPTGGAIEFDYGAGIAGDESEGGVHYMAGTGYFEIYRRVLARRVYKNANTLEEKRSYSRPVLDQAANQIDVARTHVDSISLDSNGVVLAKSRHFFYDSALDSLNQSGSNFLMGYYPNSWKSGKEFRIESLSTDGSDVPLRREEKTFKQRAHISWWPVNMPVEYEPPNDPRIDTSVTTVEPTGANLVARQTYGYDDSVQYNNQNNVKQYDFGSGTWGGLVREVQTVYVTASSYTGTGVHLRSLPETVSVLDGIGQEWARATYEYDNYIADTNHAALKDWSQITGIPMSGHDASFSSGYLTRGNLTRTTQHFLTNGSVVGSISVYSQYDLAGNIVKTIDARGFATTLEFIDRFGVPDSEAQSNTVPAELTPPGSSVLRTYAAATKATNALGQTGFTQFDYYLGKPVDVEDANAVVSSFFYNDSLDRPKKLIRVANGGSLVKSQTTIDYNDTDRVITNTSDQVSYSDNALKSETVYDGLGRPIEAREYEDGTQYIATQQVPFIVLQDPDTGAWVRAAQSSNPFRPGEQVVWTTQFSDALGRTTKIRTPDNAVMRTTYSGNSVTVTDQHDANTPGHSRTSVSDALSRIKKVYEDPNGLNYLTTYEYDVLDNLTSVTQQDPVTQVTQTRSFLYDSLKRLTSATNPESGAVNYQYDNNGNLLVKTDARGVSAHYDYDALNRLFRRWYNSSSLLTSITHNSPALPAEVGTSDEVKYFFDAQGLPSGAPTFSRGSSIGRLVGVTYGGGSSGDYYGYDEAGRINPKIQQIGGLNYLVGATYNLAGALTLQTYPSERTVNYTFDGAGRPSSVAGKLGDGNQRDYSTGIVYSPFGGMAKEQFGTTTPIYNKLFYNVRGQLAEIRAGTTYTSPTDSSWNRGAIINHYSNGYGCWGASCNAPDNNGNLMKQEYFIPTVDVPQPGPGQYEIKTQQFEHDSLNRLHSANEYSIWRQEYDYDRFGNRTINNNTSSILSPKAFEVETATNRLLGPGDSGLLNDQRLMQHDAVGNLKRDTYTGTGQRVYDTENRMTKAWGGNNQWQEYTYNGDGQRVKRKVNGVETWQVYGLGGELLAEYALNSGPLNPQKEYGHRNGELLITATVASGWGSPPVMHDNPLNPNYVGETTVQARHITELRDAINAVRTHMGLSVFSWQQPPTISVGVWIKADPIVEMRTALDQALGAPSPAYSVGLAQNLPIKAIHIQELRNRVLAAWSSGGLDIRWLITDQLGTPRMIIDQGGSLGTVTRHDYLPFGEVLSAGGRGTALGYSEADNARQKFTEKERDIETGLDYFGARYYASAQGRFTSPDPMLSSGRPYHPQSWNRYSYVINQPLTLVDPDGLDWGVRTWYDDNGVRNITYKWFDGAVDDPRYTPVNFGEDGFRTVDLSDGRTVILTNQPGRELRDITITAQTRTLPVLAPSWMDNVPVLNTSRKFLFHWGTHDFEGALLDFGKLSLEIAAIQYSASAAVTRSFATGTGEAVFWAGARDLAVSRVEQEGGRLMSQTIGGRVLTAVTKPFPERFARPFLNWGSKKFAEGAHGPIRVVLGASIRNNSTWHLVEYPILRANPFVRIIH